MCYNVNYGIWKFFFKKILFTLLISKLNLFLRRSFEAFNLGINLMKIIISVPEIETMNVSYS